MHCVGALDVSTIINYVQHCSTMFIFITSRDHFRLRLEMAIDDLYMQSSAGSFFILRTMLTGVKLLMSLPQKRQRRYTESGALLSWVPDLS